LNISIAFDGGAQGNPGPSYGSYLVQYEGALYIDRHDFGPGTNNRAEYLALISALEWTLEHHPAPESAELHVYGDSQLVIHQLDGSYRVRNLGLLPLWEQARALLARFGSVRLQWWSRDNSVKLLGH
jgi:ribonuclease HI